MLQPHSMLNPAAVQNALTHLKTHLTQFDWLKSAVHMKTHAHVALAH